MVIVFFIFSRNPVIILLNKNKYLDGYLLNKITATEVYQCMSTQDNVLDELAPADGNNFYLERMSDSSQIQASVDYSLLFKCNS